MNGRSIALEFNLGDRVEFLSEPHGINPSGLAGKLGTISLVRGMSGDTVYSIRLDQGHVIPGVEHDQIALAR